MQTSQNTGSCVFWQTFLLNPAFYRFLNVL